MSFSRLYLPKLLLRDVFIGPLSSACKEQIRKVASLVHPGHASKVCSLFLQWGTCSLLNRSKYCVEFRAKLLVHSFEFIALATNFLTHLVNLGIDMNLQVAALIEFLLTVLIESGYDLVTLEIESTLKLDTLAFNHMNKSADRALPLIAFFIISISWLCNEQISAVFLVFAPFHW